LSPSTAPKVTCVTSSKLAFTFWGQSACASCESGNRILVQLAGASNVSAKWPQSSPSTGGAAFGTGDRRSSAFAHPNRLDQQTGA
jgi:hypothetical protein